MEYRRETIDFYEYIEILLFPNIIYNIIGKSILENEKILIPMGTHLIIPNTMKDIPMYINYKRRRNIHIIMDYGSIIEFYGEWNLNKDLKRYEIHGKETNIIIEVHSSTKIILGENTIFKRKYIELMCL